MGLPGRPPICPEMVESIRQLRDEGRTYRAIERLTGVSRSTCWRYCNVKP